MTEMNNSSLLKIANRVKSVHSLNDFSKGISPKTISWFTDGSCHGNGKKSSSGGFAAISVSGYRQNAFIYGKVDDRLIKATNIRAEGTAILLILENLLEIIDNKSWDKSVIYSDSEFWIKMIYNYMPKWKSDTFDQKANPDMTKQIWRLWNRINVDKHIEIIHVYAHNKDNSAGSADPYKRFCHNNNEIADDLANLARELPDYRIRKEMF